MKCKASKHWKCTKLGFAGNVIEDQDIPGFVYEDIIVPKAARGLRAAAGMSDQQKEKVIARVRADPERAKSSGTYSAIRQDKILRDS